MKLDLRDLTVGPLGRQIFKFSIPLILSNLLQVLFNMSDIAVVGRFAGSLALGAVGSTTTLVMLFTGFLMGLGSGVNILTAIHYGAKSERDLTETVHSSALICFIGGFVIMLLGEVTCRPILDLLHTKDELIDGASKYLHIYFLGMPALAMYNFGNGVYSAVGNTRKPLAFLSLAGVINVALNLFFVIVCGMDVDGVAVASVISQYISAVLIVAALLRCRDNYGLRLSCLRITWNKARRILEIGIPAGLQHGIFAVANLFIQAGVNSFDAVMVSGNAAAANADNLIYDVMMAFYTACTSFMGQNLGAKKNERIMKSYRICLVYSSGAALIMGGLLILFGAQFLSLFTKEADVIEAGMKRLSIMSCTYWVSAFMDCTISASRGLGKSLVPTIIVILGSCIFRIVWIYTVFAYFSTISSLYLLYVFSWSITAVAEIIYFRRCYKQQMELISMPVSGAI